MLFVVEGTIVMVIVVASPDGEARAHAAVADCACKKLVSAMQKLVRLVIAFVSLTSVASRRRSLIARMSRTLLFSGAFRAVPSASTSLH